MRENNLLLLVPNLSLGGQQRVAVNTAKILRDDKNVTIAIFDGNNIVFDTDANVVNLNIPAAKNPIQRVLNVFRRISAVNRLKRELDIGCTISFGVSANLVNALTRQKDRLILAVHGYGSVPEKPLAKRKWHFLFQKADLVICVSKHMAQRIAETCNLKKEKVCAVYNPYDFHEMLRLSREKTEVSIKEPAVVGIGRLVEVKGFHHLIRAVKIASERIPGLRLVLIGEGPLEDDLRKLAEKHEVEVEFTGFQKNPFSIISQCSCFALSSTHEGFPNALVEAMACGIPAVAVDCMTGPREILDYDKTPVIHDLVETEYGILCPTFETECSCEPVQEKILANAIVKVLQDPTYRANYCVRAQLRAKMFSFEQYRERLFDVVFQNEKK